MSGSIVVDSNVYIGLMRRRLNPVHCLGSWLEDNDLATCGIIRVEVERGLRVEKVQRHMAAFFDVMINIPTSNRIWMQTAELAWQLDRSGYVIPAQDILIAVSARAIGASVLTDDAHFQQIPGLPLLNPAHELPGW